MKKIKLSQYSGRYEDVSPFPVGELEILIDGLPNESGDFRFIGKMNGLKVAEFTVCPHENTVKISADNLCAGAFSCEIHQYLKGVLIKRWKVEDLLITDLAGTLSAEPEIAQMSRKILALEKQAQEEKQAREEMLNATADAFIYYKQIIFGLLKFAYKDYCENVYLNGGDFDKFLQDFGIDLSKSLQKEIDEIKGENDNVEIN